MQWKAIVGALALLFVGVAIWYAYQKQGIEPATPPAGFVHDGTVIKDNPGFKPGIWYMSYEEPGSPALSAELDLNSVDAPYISLTQGERVHVEGTLSGSVVTVRSITSLSAETGTNIKLYFYKPSLDGGQGGAQCSTKGLVGVVRVLPKTSTPLQDSIRLLLRGELSDEERSEGITTEFPLEGVLLEKANIENGIATLKFDDPLHKTGGGSCRVSILRHEIEETAKQFSNVKSVRIEPEELFQP